MASSECDVSRASPAQGVGEGPSRFDWLDAARGINILMVVAVHGVHGLVEAGRLSATPGYVAVNAAAYAFRMPLFFFLAGLFAAGDLPRGPGAFLRHRLAVIAYPYLLWSLIQGGLSAMLSNYVNDPVPATQLLFLGWQPFGQFWFLYVLMLCHAALLACGRRGLLLAAVPGVAVASLIGSATMTGTLCTYLPYFAVGAWLGGKRLAALVDHLRRPYRTYAAICLIYAFLLVLLWARVQLLPNGVLIKLALGFGGSAVLIGGCWLLRGRTGLLERIGRVTLPILLLHVLASAGLRIGLSMLGVELAPLLLLGAVVLVGVVVPLAASRISRRAGIRGVVGFGAVRPGRGLPAMLLVLVVVAALPFAVGHPPPSQAWRTLALLGLVLGIIAVWRWRAGAFTPTPRVAETGAMHAGSAVLP